MSTLKHIYPQLLLANTELIPPQRRTLQHGTTTIAHIGSVNLYSNLELAQVVGELLHAFLG